MMILAFLSPTSLPSTTITPLINRRHPFQYRHQHGRQTTIQSLPFTRILTSASFSSAVNSGGQQDLDKRRQRWQRLHVGAERVPAGDEQAEQGSSVLLATTRSGSLQGIGREKNKGVEGWWRSLKAVSRFALVWLSVVAKRINKVRRGRFGRLAMLGVSLLMMSIFRGRIRIPGHTGTATSAIVSVPALPQIGSPSWLTRIIPGGLHGLFRPFGEAFGVVFLSEFGDKSMFATALMAMKQNPFLVFVGAIVALTTMTLIACFLGQFMQLLPSFVTHYSTILLFMFFGLQMILQARNLPDKPGGSGGEKADAEEMIKNAHVSDKKGTVLAKICSLIFVAEWCDRSMLATMALAASSNTLAVVGGATAANVLCTAVAVIGAALVSSRISERLVALVSGILFEFFALFTFLEGPEN